MGQLLRSFCSLLCLTFRQWGLSGRNAVLGQLLKGGVAWLSVSPHHSTLGGTIWYLTAFTNTTDRQHQSRVHLSWELPSMRICTERWVECRYYTMNLLVNQNSLQLLTWYCIESFDSHLLILRSIVQQLHQQRQQIGFDDGILAVWIVLSQRGYQIRRSPSQLYMPAF